MTNFSLQKTKKYIMQLFMKFTVLISLFLFINPATLDAQVNYSTHKKSAIKAYNEGMQYLNEKQYDHAVSRFQRAIAIDKNFIEAYLLMAQTYEDLKQYKEAIQAYHNGLNINPEFHPYSFIVLGDLEFKLSRYEDAMKSYQAFLDTESKNQKQVSIAEKNIERCRFSINAMANPVPFVPENLGPAINTIDDEYWPCLTADESTLIFTRLLKDSSSYAGFQEDFFISKKERQGWGMAKNAGFPLNSPFNEGAQTISADGRLMVFTACGRKDGLGRCDLYLSRKTGDAWSLPRNIGKPVNTGSYETQPSLSADGNTLYFASDRPGGFGDIDIYVTTMNDQDNWSIPINLGEIINTAGRDWAPFIHPDNQTLYFASNEHIGLGGFDLFYSKRDTAGNWSKPVNLGYPVNTGSDEFGLILNAAGDHAYFASDMDSANGKDIFTFNLYTGARPTEVSYLKGKVFDADTKKVLGAGFELIDLKSNQVVSHSFSDSLTGEFLVCIPANHDYMLNVSKYGYLFYSDNFTLDNIFRISEPFLKDIPLQPIKIGKSVILKNIFYEFDSYVLKDESKIELNKLIQFLKAYPSIKIEVSGHTDNIGSTGYNQTLSEQRAGSVAEYLTNSSIDKERIKYTGYGFSRPLTSNDSEEGRALNRRTELVITEK
jgi:outer membrane protein OmpA-like peptidoglycan-associated protein/tetratricopeptide (TPR) repeat protein